MMMEFLIPIMFAVFKKCLAATLATLMLYTALRISDRRAGINFEQIWVDAKAEAKISFLNNRRICYTLLFLGCFTLA